jgi:hypothetical protein
MKPNLMAQSFLPAEESSPRRIRAHLGSVVRVLDICCDHGDSFLWPPGGVSVSTNTITSTRKTEILLWVYIAPVTSRILKAARQQTAGSIATGGG